jgi:pilus assembly protein Flp/PilA
MDFIKAQAKRFTREESGQDIIEYALMIVLVALVVVGAVPNISTAVSQVFSKAISALGG